MSKFVGVRVEACDFLSEGLDAARELKAPVHGPLVFGVCECACVSSTQNIVTVKAELFGFHAACPAYNMGAMLPWLLLVVLPERQRSGCSRSTVERKKIGRECGGG